MLSADNTSRQRVKVDSCHMFQHIPNYVVGIHTMGNRVVVADIQESFHFVRYKRAENQLIVFADDTNPRWITAMCMLDYDTVAGADKFGNITVVSTSNICLDKQKILA